VSEWIRPSNHQRSPSKGLCLFLCFSWEAKDLSSLYRFVLQLADLRCYRRGGSSGAPGLLGVVGDVLHPTSVVGLGWAEAGFPLETTMQEEAKKRFRR
jgi:hypothetical protein